MQRRLPKRGFTNIFRKSYRIINVKDLNRFEAKSNLDTKALKEAGLVKKGNDRVKILGSGEISHPLFIKAHKVSRTAREKIESAGGKIEIVA